MIHILTLNALIRWFCLVYITSIQFDYNIACKQIKIWHVTLFDVCFMRTYYCSNLNFNESNIFFSESLFVFSSFFSFSIFISTTIKKLWRHWKSVPDAAKICFRAKGRRSLWAISEIMHHSLHRKVASGLTREKTGENWIYSLFEAALFTCILTPVSPSMLATVICKLRLDLHLFDSLALLHFLFWLNCDVVSIWYVVE